LNKVNSKDLLDSPGCFTATYNLSKTERSTDFLLAPPPCGKKDSLTFKRDVVSFLHDPQSSGSKSLVSHWEAKKDELKKSKGADAFKGEHTTEYTQDFNRSTRHFVMNQAEVLTHDPRSLPEATETLRLMISSSPQYGREVNKDKAEEMRYIIENLMSQGLQAEGFGILREMRSNEGDPVEDKAHPGKYEVNLNGNRLSITGTTNYEIWGNDENGNRVLKGRDVVDARIEIDLSKVNPEDIYDRDKLQALAQAGAVDIQYSFSPMRSP
jgi:hypothetical protein